MKTRFEPSPACVTRIGRSGSETPVSSGLFQPGHFTSGNATLILSGKGRVSISSAATERARQAAAAQATGNNSLRTKPGIVAIPLIDQRQYGKACSGAVRQSSSVTAVSVPALVSGTSSFPLLASKKISAGDLNPLSNSV